MLTRSRLLVLGIILVATGTTTFAVRQASVADMRLQGALTKEIVEGKCDEAIPLYQQVLSTPGVSRATAAKAQLHISGCQGTFRQSNLRLRTALLERAAMSPDGKMLAYQFMIEENSTLRPGLMLLNLVTNEEQRLDDRQGPFSQAGQTPQWSPDSRRLAYQVRNNQTNVGELRVITVATGQIRTVRTSQPAAAAARVFVFAWAGDSDTIASHVRPDPPARGTGPRVPEAGDVVLVSATSGSSRTIGSSELIGPFFSWSHDGRSVAFREIRAAEKVHRIRVINVATGQGPSFDGVGTGFAVRFSPDDQRAAVRETDSISGLDQIRIFTVASGESRVVSVPADIAGAGFPEWTRKNEFLLTLASGNRQFLMPATGGVARKLCETQQNGDTCLFLTPNGGSQLLRNAAGRLVVRKTADGTDVPLTMGAGEENAPMLSADGRIVVFASNRTGTWALYAVPLDRAPVQDPVVIATVEPVAATGRVPGVLGANGNVLFQSRAGEDNIYRIDLDRQSGRAIEGRKPVRLTLNYPVNDWPEPSPDGKQIAFRYSRGTRSGVAVMASDGSRERSLVEYASVKFASPGQAAVAANEPARLADNLVWRSAEEVMFFQPGETPAAGRLRVANIRTGEVETLPLTLRLDVRSMGLAWTYVPSRDEILYVLPGAAFPAHAPGTLKARHLKTGAERVVMDNLAEFVVSADARLIAFRRDLADRAVELRRASIDGQDLGLLKSYPARTDCCPASPESLSPDGRFFLFSGPSGRHRVISVAGGEDSLLFDHNADLTVEEWDFPGARWSPDGSYVVVEGFTTRVETRLWQGVTYEAVTKLIPARR